MNSYKDQTFNLETQTNKQKSESFITEIKNNKKINVIIRKIKVLKV